MRKPVIVVILDYYLPAFKAGGPLRSIANLIDALGGEFDFHVLTRDRDQGDAVPFAGVEAGRWIDREGYRVLHLPPPELGLRSLRRRVSELDCDLIYLNSFFSRLTRNVLLLRRLGLLPRVPVILAPRGELAPQALGLKRRKKAPYLRLARAVGLYRGITWHASSAEERAEIERFGSGPVEVAANLPAPGMSRPATPPARPPKAAGSARIVFLSRVARKKNLDYALRLLARARGEIVFDVYGTPEDPQYLAECQALIERLPPNVHGSYRGAVPHERVYETLAGYHLFLFPTLNENFGHVVLEALHAGLPVIVSDATYWVDLERRGVGHDVPLADEARFLECIERLVALDGESYAAMSRRAVELARAYVEDPRPREAHRRLFREGLARACPTD